MAGQRGRLTDRDVVLEVGGAELDVAEDAVPAPVDEETGLVAFVQPR